MMKRQARTLTLLLYVDFDLQPETARYYRVARAPALVLLDAQGRVAWKQDVGLNDSKPLDLVEAEAQIILLQQ